MGRSSKNRIRKLAAMLLCAVIVAGLGISALAATTIDFDAKGTITLKSRFGSTDMVAGADGGSFKLYHVAKIVKGKVNIEFELIHPFDDYDKDINLVKSAVDNEAAALALRAYITQVDENDVIKMNNGDTATGLELGIYLVVQTSVPSGYTASAPFLIFVPMTSADGTAWLYGITAYPKLGEIITSPPPSESPPPYYSPPPTSNPTPTPIDIFDDPPPLIDIEPDPDPEIEIEEEEPPLADAPQTGIVQWPIPVLFSSGMMLFGCGLLTDRKKKKDDE